MKEIKVYWRNRYFLIIDWLGITTAVWLSFCLRFETLDAFQFIQTWDVYLPLVLVVRPLVFYPFGLYGRLWRYASVQEIVDVLVAVVTGSIVVAFLMLGIIRPLQIAVGFPRSILILETMLTLFILGGARLVPRMLASHNPSGKGVARSNNGGQPQRVLIAGSGDAGSMVVREILANPGIALVPVAFVDDDGQKHGLSLHGVSVMGSCDHIPEIVRKQRADLVIIAMPTASGKVIRDIVQTCQKVGVRCQTVPGLYELITGERQLSDFRNVRVEDLLRRQPVAIDLSEVALFLKGKRVAITGAGGSIGSELSRQVAEFSPESVLLFEIAENNLFSVHNHLAERFPQIQFVPTIGDVRNRNRVMSIFDEHRPQIVFHAAAHKHVPLMELNPWEAVSNNIFGTQNIIEAALRVDTKHFVLVSTDKAVMPSSAMGVSKRVAELLTQRAAYNKGSAFVAVRFGNVLGSSGSVIPLFQEQIAKGGPVRVTDPEAERYFMTAQEAVSLILQAAAIGRGGELFVLDMGEAVKIVDLAHDLIRLSGLEPGRDIDILFTRLRPGEKLREELFAPLQERGVTKHKGIYVAQDQPPDGLKLEKHLEELKRLLETGDGLVLKRKLKEIVPEYQPYETMQTTS